MPNNKFVKVLTLFGLTVNQLIATFCYCAEIFLMSDVTHWYQYVILALMSLSTVGWAVVLSHFVGDNV